MATRAQLRALVLRDVQDAAGRYLSPTTVNDLLNEGARKFSQLTRCNRSTTTLTATAGSATVSLAAVTPGVLDVLRVWFNGEELDYWTYEDLAQSYPYYLTDGGTPLRYCRTDQGALSLRLHPIPDDTLTAEVTTGTFANTARGIIRSIRGLTAAQATAAFGGTAAIRYLSSGVRVDYVAEAVDMSADGNSPDIPAAFHEACYLYACLQFHSRIDIPLTQPDKIALYQAAFDTEVAKCLKQVSAGFQRKPAGSARTNRMEMF